MITFIFAIVACGAVGGGMRSHGLELSKQLTLINISPMVYDCFEAETFVYILHSLL